MQKTILKRWISLLLAVIIVSVAAFVYIDISLRPLIRKYARSQVEILLNNAVSKSMSNVLKKEKFTYSDLSVIERDSDGNVKSIEIDTLNMNRIVSEIVDDVQHNMINDENFSISVPLGTLTGSQYLVGRGPDIKVKTKISTPMFTDTESRFLEAGINQTLHQITLTIRSDIYILMPLYRAEELVSGTYIIAETVVVGDIPEAYTNVIDVSEESDVPDDINNYSAEKID